VRKVGDITFHVLALLEFMWLTRQKAEWGKISGIQPTSARVVGTRVVGRGSMFSDAIASSLDGLDLIVESFDGATVVLSSK